MRLHKQRIRPMLLAIDRPLRETALAPSDLRDFGKARKVSSTTFYWFDDTGGGNCRVPQSWRLVYRDGDSWKPVETDSTFNTLPNTYNQVRFTPVETTALRIEVRLQR